MSFKISASRTGLDLFDYACSTRTGLLLEKGLTLPKGVRMMGTFPNGSALGRGKRRLFKVFRCVKEVERFLIGYNILQALVKTHSAGKPAAVKIYRHIHGMVVTESVTPSECQ